MNETDPITTNRACWNSISDDYQERHGDALKDAPLAWGVWRIPEATVGVLGEVAGKDVLELGCGSAQWSVALAKIGANAIGMDVSERQLAHANRHVSLSGEKVPLIQASGDCLPFDQGAFDIVFCDHGAMTFCSPFRTVPEVSRILKQGGVLAFCMSTPIRDVCSTTAEQDVGDRLIGNYFGLSVCDDDGMVSYQLAYGAWIRLFRQSGFVVEDLIELQAPRVASTSYSDYVSSGWARKWPAENIWKVRRSA